MTTAQLLKALKDEDVPHAHCASADDLRELYVRYRGDPEATRAAAAEAAAAAAGGGANWRSSSSARASCLCCGASGRRASSRRRPVVAILTRRGAPTSTRSPRRPLAGRTTSSD